MSELPLDSLTSEECAVEAETMCHRILEANDPHRIRVIDGKAFVQQDSVVLELAREVPGWLFDMLEEVKVTGDIRRVLTKACEYSYQRSIGLDKAADPMGESPSYWTRMLKSALDYSDGKPAQCTREPCVCPECLCEEVDRGAAAATHQPVEHATSSQAARTDENV